MGYFSHNDERNFDRFQIMDYAMIRTSQHEEPVQCEIIDVSLSGLQLRSEGPLPVGELCELIIGRREEEQFLVQGDIRYTNSNIEEEGHLTGIRFLPQSHEQRAAIAKYIHSAFMRQCPVVRCPQKRAA